MSKIKNIVIYGTGLIGSSWATIFALRGINVCMYDINEESIELSYKRIKNNLSILVQENVIKQSEIEQIISKITSTLNAEEALKNAEFIQENGPENCEIKQTIIASIEKFAPVDAIIATSTSGLLVSNIAAKAEHPERIVGAHPYNPPHLIPLVELCKGKETGDKFLQKTYDFYKEANREPVIMKKEAPGFIANRLQIAVIREAIELVLRGVCTIEDVDKACLFGPGLRWGILGPMTNMQLAAGPHGVKGALLHLGPSTETWLKDMATWNKYPEGIEHCAQICQDGMNEELINRSEDFGKDNASIEKFRDKILVKLLKEHKKI